MSIKPNPGTCIVVHLTTSEGHFPDTAQAQAWASTLSPAEYTIRAIEPARTPCWTAYCDNPTCQHPEGDENDNPTHLPGTTAEEAEQQLGDLQRDTNGSLLCTTCREEAA